MSACYVLAGIPRFRFAFSLSLPTRHSGCIPSQSCLLTNGGAFRRLRLRRRRSPNLLNWPSLLFTESFLSSLPRPAPTLEFRERKEKKGGGEAFQSAPRSVGADDEMMLSLFHAKLQDVFLLVFFRQNISSSSSSRQARSKRPRVRHDRLDRRAGILISLRVVLPGGGRRRGGRRIERHADIVFSRHLPGMMIGGCREGVVKSLLAGGEGGDWKLPPGEIAWPEG